MLTRLLALRISSPANATACSLLKGCLVPFSNFQPPTREELNLEASKIGLPYVEVDKFVNFYESKGWMVGKNKMKSWRGALAGWRTRWEERRSTERVAPGMTTKREAEEAELSRIDRITQSALRATDHLV